MDAEINQQTDELMAEITPICDKYNASAVLMVGINIVASYLQAVDPELAKRFVDLITEDDVHDVA